ncbi:hypothetical protein [Deinococcus terrestris]|uniref:hypothetical protein n=1 Tax=Deinococcus terrestris TaxID=2651870 RepID=UPI001883CE72|nr:hypothetical protein [Deinococcus terrestris]
MRNLFPLLLLTLTAACYVLAGSESPAAYAAAVCGPALAFLSLGVLLSRTRGQA